MSAPELALGLLALWATTIAAAVGISWCSRFLAQRKEVPHEPHPVLKAAADQRTSGIDRTDPGLRKGGSVRPGGSSR